MPPPAGQPPADRLPGQQQQPAAAVAVPALRDECRGGRVGVPLRLPPHGESSARTTGSEEEIRMADETRQVARNCFPLRHTGALLVAMIMLLGA
eukprot:scaffold298444_cov30-Prasinocladus_malaysianus.AAC.1